jgi:hypothetical protein
MQERPEHKLLRSSRTFLGRWQNAALRTVPHGPSLAHLVLVLSREDRSQSENLTIAVAPLWWHGPFELAEAALSVELIDADLSEAASLTRYDEIFRIIDPESGLTCLTEWIEVKENVRLDRVP